MSHYDEEKLEAYVKEIQDSYTEPFVSQPSKYHVKIQSKNGWSDVYDVLCAYRVENPALAHAIKKLLMAGNRGYKDFKQDLEEAIQAIERGKDFPPVPF